jgi:formate dehydrogenase (coenzyme F420) alpha subunit
VTAPAPRFGNLRPQVEGDPIGSDQYPLFFEMWGRKSPYGVVTVVPESIPEKLKAFLVVGGNPLVSMPDSNAFKEAFKKLDLLVVHDLFMTETAKLAHYVLPACSHLEKWGVAYTYNVCHCIPFIMLRKKCIEPLHESRSEWRFFTELGRKARNGGAVSMEDRKSRWSPSNWLPSGFSFAHLLKEKPEGVFTRRKNTKARRGFSAPLPGESKFTARPWKKPGLILSPRSSSRKEALDGGTRKFLKNTPSSFPQATAISTTPTASSAGSRLCKGVSRAPCGNRPQDRREAFGLKDGDMQRL